MRYIKYFWDNLDYLPEIGIVDYVPKNQRSIRLFSNGKFTPEHNYTIPLVKKKTMIGGFGCCAICGKSTDSDGKKTKLTSEHIIPEFLGSGIELSGSSCYACQAATSYFESNVASSLFDPVRKQFSLSGKNGVIDSSNFPIDIGRETSDKVFIPLRHFPTILTMPRLYPASSYSNRQLDSFDIFGATLYNINADKNFLKKYAIDAVSSQIIDLVSFCQLIAKIAHVSVVSIHGFHSFRPFLNQFITEKFPKDKANVGHFNFIGGFMQPEQVSAELHEIDIGYMEWAGKKMLAARVRLFACYGMPSYYVTVGEMHVDSE